MDYREKEIFHIRAPKYTVGSIRDRNKLLDEEVSSSTALYRGVSTAYFLGSLADLSYPSSAPEKYSALGSGIYLTPSRDYAFEYANPGSVLVFKGLNDPKALEKRPKEGCSDNNARKLGRRLRVVQYKATDTTWRRIVTALVASLLEALSLTSSRRNIQANRSGIPQPDYSRVPGRDLEDYINADVIIAPVVANFDAIRRGLEEPKPEDHLEYVFRSSEVLKEALAGVVEVVV